MIEKEYIKTVINYEKLDANLKAEAYGSKIGYIGGKSDHPGKVYVYLTTDFTAQEDTDCNTFIQAFVDFTTAEQLKIHLDDNVFPFAEDVLHRYAAENIAMGITQLNKAGPVLGLFEKGYDIYANGLPISLKAAFDTGSLYEAVAIMDHLLANPTEFSGLDPFVTTQRLTDIKNELLAFLAG